MNPTSAPRGSAGDLHRIARAGPGSALALAALALLAGCGGAARAKAIAPAAEPAPGMTAEDMIPRAVLESAELTTAVDEERYVAAAEVRTEFPPEEEVIYLVGKLKWVPTQARIEVRWYRDADPQPMLVSVVNGSDTFSFVASLRPVGPRFIAGPHSARVFVDGREVGGATFTILGTPPSLSGAAVSKVKLSTAVGAKMRPKRPATEFAAGTERLFVTFDVAGAPADTVALVRWTRGGEVFHEEEVEVGPAGRFGAELAAPAGLPDGAYAVAVGVGGADDVEVAFTVGDGATGPRVDRLELGHTLGDDSLPERPVTTFSRRDDAVRCGLRFLDLPPDSRIAVQWLAVEEGAEPVPMHTVANALPTGGSGTMAAEWPAPDGGFEPGAYKVVVTVGAEALAELAFTIE